jgi:hypothetical protein
MWVCSLAVLIPAAAEGFQVDDCRVPFDPLTAPKPEGGADCCCVKVGPEQAAGLQKIIDDAVKGVNGAAVSIHLEPGVYQLRRPLIIDQRHKGIVIEACAGAKPVITGSKDKRFVNGLILALAADNVAIRGIEFRTVATPIPDELLSVMTKVTKAEMHFSIPLRTFSIGIRAVQCLSLSIEDCDFRFPRADATFGAGILIQGDNGKIEATRCRFTAEAAEASSIMLGICLAPILMNEDGLLKLSSVELLRISECLFALLTVGILLSSRPLLVSIEGNTTRFMHSSLLVLWYDEKVQRVSNVFELLEVKVGSAMLKDFLAEFKQTALTRRAIGITLLLMLGELAGLGNVSKREFIHALGDLKIDAARLQSGTSTLRLAVESNHLDSRPGPALGNAKSGSDTLIWDLTSQAAVVTMTGNTMWNTSGLATAAVLLCGGFNVTGNVIGNDFVQLAKGPNTVRMGLLVAPATPAVPGRVTINMFTVTGNTIFGRTNLADFPRQEWTTVLPKEFAPILTWEFFNTIA